MNATESAKKAQVKSSLIGLGIMEILKLAFSGAIPETKPTPPARPDQNALEKEDSPLFRQLLSAADQLVQEFSKMADEHEANFHKPGGLRDKAKCDELRRKAKVVEQQIETLESLSRLAAYDAHIRSELGKKEGKLIRHRLIEAIKTAITSGRTVTYEPNVETDMAGGEIPVAVVTDEATKALYSLFKELVREGLLSCRFSEKQSDAETMKIVSNMTLTQVQLSVETFRLYSLLLNTVSELFWQTVLDAFPNTQFYPTGIRRGWKLVILPATNAD